MSHLHKITVKFKLILYFLNKHKLTELTVCLCLGIFFTVFTVYSSELNTNPFRTKLIKTAFSFIDTPYKWGGTTAEGVDCSGLINAIFHKHKIILPRTTEEMFSNGFEINYENIRAGDILFFKFDGDKVNHAGIYIGEGLFIHAPGTGKRVTINNLNNYYINHLTGIRDYVDLHIKTASFSKLMEHYN